METQTVPTLYMKSSPI